MKRMKFPTACLILLAGPAALLGQKKEDILEIQRDVALLQDQVRQLQKSQDDKMAALKPMLQQPVDVSNKLAAGLSSLQRQIDQRLSSEQTQLVAPVATLGAKVDQMSSDFSSVATNVEELVRRMAALDTKLNDISQAVRTLSAPPTPPPPAAGSAAGAAAPAVSAETSYNNAYRDYMKGQNDLALQEFADYVKNFPDTADAAKAFDDVLELWPENPKTADAMYYKGVALQKLGQKTAAAKVLKDYIAKYPRGEHVEQAHRDLRAMGMEASTAKKQRK